MRLHPRLCLLPLFTLTLLAQDRQPGRSVNFYSKEKEAALGAHLAGEVRQNSTPLDSTSVRDYVTQLGAKLAAQLPGAGFPFTFAVIAENRTNLTHEPLALPGGYIFVPASLIITARNEAEFAGMLAHAMAHVAARHGTRQATRSELANTSSVPLIYMGSWSGVAMQQGQAVSLPLGFLRLQRAFELEADRLAVAAMAGAGYDPDGLTRYVNRVQPAEDNQATSNAFSALPTRDVRLAGIEQTIQQLPARAYSSSDTFQSIQDEVRRLLPHALPQ